MPVSCIRSARGSEAGTSRATRPACRGSLRRAPTRATRVEDRPVGWFPRQRPLQAGDGAPITPAFIGRGDVTLTVADDLVRRGADEPARRFADLVKLSGLQTRYIDREREQRLLEEAVTRFDLSLDQARGIMRSGSKPPERSSSYSSR
jgi:hypothetical protein